MEEKNFNIEFTFSYKGEKEPTIAYTSAQYIKPSESKMDIKEVYDKNETLVRGDIQLALSKITSKKEALLLTNLEVKNEDEIVFKASEYEILHIPPMNK